MNIIPLIPGTTTAGPSTSYTIYQGRIFGLLDPTNSLNSIITDLSLASWSGFPSAGANGQAQYVANFQIVTPTNAAQRSGLMIQEVPNRGGNTITIPAAGTTSSLVQGATYVQSGWQGDLLSQCAGTSTVPLYPCVNLTSGAYGTLNTSTGAFTAPTVGTSALAAYVVQVPVATTDGNPAPGYTGNTSSNIITGTVYSHICNGIISNAENGCGLATTTPPTTSLLQVQSAGGAGYEPYLPAGYLSRAGRRATRAPPFGPLHRKRSRASKAQRPRSPMRIGRGQTALLAGLAHPIRIMSATTVASIRACSMR